MGSQFSVGEAVVCIDASDLPSPPWVPLVCGANYVIRTVDMIPEANGNYDKNIHKKARYCIKLWGITNFIHPVFKKEFAYAETRFAKIDIIADRITVKEEMVA